MWIGIIRRSNLSSECRDITLNPRPTQGTLFAEQLQQHDPKGIEAWSRGLTTIQ